MEKTIELIKLWAKERDLLRRDIVHQQMTKLVEEMGELASGISKNKPLEIRDSIGDIMVVLTILSEQLGLDIKDCLYSAFNEIKNRKGKTINGTFIKESDLNSHQKDLTNAPECKMCDGTGYKDRYGFSMDECNHTPIGEDVKEAVEYLDRLFEGFDTGLGEEVTSINIKSKKGIDSLRTLIRASQSKNPNYKFVYVDDLIRLVSDAGEVWEGESQMEVLSTEQEEQIEIAIRDYFNRDAQSNANAPEVVEAEEIHTIIRDACIELKYIIEQQHIEAITLALEKSGYLCAYIAEPFIGSDR